MGVIRGMGSARELGAELRALREAQGLTTRQVAERAGTSQANISHWETGKRLVSDDKLEAVLDALHVTPDDRERLLGLRRQAEGPGTLHTGVPSIGDQLTQLIEYEQTATRITDISPLVLPGLLQTSDYARAVLGDGPDTYMRVVLRAGRRDVLTRVENPVEFHAFIDSEALLRPVAEPDVMVAQMHHLLRMAKLPNVTIQLVSSTRRGWHPMLAGPFIILEFATAAPIVHLEHYRASAFLWEREDVAAFLAAPDEIRKIAMTPERTSEVITEITEGMQRS